MILYQLAHNLERKLIQRFKLSLENMLEFKSYGFKLDCVGSVDSRLGGYSEVFGGERGGLDTGV